MSLATTISNLANAEYIYRNPAQMRADIMFCRTEVHLLARGVGKSQGIIAARSERLVHEMPKSTGAFITRTFQKALTNTLPPVITGWKDMGYIEGIHFVIGKRPPEWFEKPLTEPLDYRYVISWYCGTVIHIVSQDRPGSANGLSIDWSIVDEAKLINKTKFDHEISPAMRGNRNVFGHLSCHQSVLFCTDRWYGAEAKWIDELEKEVDPIANKMIWSLSCEVNKLERNLLEKEYSESYRESLRKRINSLNRDLTRLRKRAVYFNYASAIENIHVLGDEYILQQRQALPDIVFRVTVLNEKRSMSESPFYPHLNRNYHLYTNFNNDLFDALEYDFQAIRNLTCEKDKDLIPGSKLYIGLDPGGVINTVVVGIFDEDDRIRVINSFFVKKPELTKHLIKMLCRYYHAHDNHHVVYYYDPTHIAKHGTTTLSYKEAIINEFKANNWKVTAKFIGAVPEPQQRYKLAATYLEKKHKTPFISFNETNCEYLLISMEDADTEEHKGIYRKNKNSEKASSGVEPEKATHFSDAFDTLLWGMHHYPHPEYIDEDISFMTSK